jgi:hypothetical protein
MTNGVREMHSHLNDGSTSDELGLSGQLSGNGSAQLTGSNIFSSNGNMIVRGDDVKAMLVDGLPPVELGAVWGKILLKHGVATLQEMNAKGPDGSAEANGWVGIAPDITHSIVQLSLSLKPSLKGRANFGVFLNMLPHPPTEGPYHIQGLLTSPSLS